MTLATYTSTVYDNTPKFHHVGLVKQRGQVKWTAAGSVGDVLFACKVPHGAEIIDFYEYHTNGQTAAVLDWGFTKGIAAGGGANISCLVSGGAVATMNRMSLAASPNTGKGGLTISLSDTDPIRFTSLAAKAISGTFTITVVANFCLTYSFDGPAPR
jgi:hypothetical protein